jgi:hypothetical protein
VVPRRTGVKGKSLSNLCEVVGVDLFKTSRKLTHVMERVAVPAHLSTPLSTSNDSLYFPQVGGLSNF